MFLENSLYICIVHPNYLLKLFIEHGNPDVFCSAGKGDKLPIPCCHYNRASGNKVKESILATSWKGE
jgi:hypothetical protein